MGKLNGVLVCVVSLVAALVRLRRVDASCTMHNECNGHGTCTTSTSSCTCYEGWGASTDTTLYRSPDCSERVCPAGKAWGDVPTAVNTAHALAECSDRGLCDRAMGTCTCFEGFVGDACQRSSCPNDCSGHGQCVSIKRMATLTNALPLSNTTTYTGNDDTTTWDEEMIYGCVCDSSWSVGLESGNRQEPEYFGADCSLKHCPSGNDPNTDADEEDCGLKWAAGSKGKGRVGNKCHVDCSNRGLCDYTTGTCECFDGYFGENCNARSALAVY